MSFYRGIWKWHHSRASQVDIFNHAWLLAPPRREFGNTERYCKFLDFRHTSENATDNTQIFDCLIISRLYGGKFLHEELSKPGLEMEYFFEKITHSILLGNCPN
jgi:hypothetical protein